MADLNPRHNIEGYPDPTAYNAVIRQEIQLENRHKKLIGVLKFIIAQCGFSLEERIILKDKNREEYFINFKVKVLSNFGKPSPFIIRRE
ncbi:MAG: hypothetical protein LUD77_10115 [Clostridiales bacterium]|nr:hypothetical protein [Clostridiales bacterium]